MERGSGIQEFKVPGPNALPRPKPKTSDGAIENSNRTTVLKCPSDEGVMGDDEEPNFASPEPVLSPLKEPISTQVSSGSNSTKDQDPAKLAKYAAMLAQLKYKEPDGASPFDSRYSFEVLKTGSILDKIEFDTTKSFCIIGRIPACDFEFQHPTISRTHAVIQYFGNKSVDGQDGSKSHAPGLYVYDLNSTHGTFLNKNQLIPGRYYRLHVGHVLKFGSSSRLYVVVGPDDDAEEESEKTVTEMVKERNEKVLKRQNAAWKSGTAGKDGDSDEEDEGASWGMSEDAVEENALSINPFALDFQESIELSLDNPKRTLHSWFEREGYDLFYDVKEKSSGHFICTINLPLDGSNATPVIAEVDAKGKKKEIMAQCALKACQILDKYGVLRKSNQEGMKRKSKDWEEKDYYSSDEDTFLDRTGSVERKRNFRMKQAGKLEEKVETFDSLVTQYNEVDSELNGLEQKIQEVESKSRADEGSGMADPLDAFMQDLKSGVTDVHKMKSKVKELSETRSRLLQLINMVKPFGVTFPDNQNFGNILKSNDSPSRAQLEKKTTIMFGPRKGSTLSGKKSLTVTKSLNPPTSQPSQPVVVDLAEDDDGVKMETIDSGLPGDVDSPETSTKKSGICVGKSLDTVKKRPNPDRVEHGSESDPEEAEEEIPKPKRRRNRQPKKQVSLEYDLNNPDYSVWVPPSDQLGDGKTKLNEKLGY